MQQQQHQQLYFFPRHLLMSLSNLMDLLAIRTEKRSIINRIHIGIRCTNPVNAITAKYLACFVNEERYWISCGNVHQLKSQLQNLANFDRKTNEIII